MKGLFITLSSSLVICQGLTPWGQGWTGTGHWKYIQYIQIVKRKRGSNAIFHWILSVRSYIFRVSWTRPPATMNIARVGLLREWWQPVQVPDSLSGSWGTKESNVAPTYPCQWVSQSVSGLVIHSFRFGDSYRITKLCEPVSEHTSTSSTWKRWKRSCWSWTSFGWWRKVIPATGTLMLTLVDQKWK